MLYFPMISENFRKYPLNVWRIFKFKGPSRRNYLLKHMISFAFVRDFVGPHIGLVGVCVGAPVGLVGVPVGLVGVCIGSTRLFRFWYR